MLKIIKSLSVSGISIALAIATMLFQVAGQSAGANKIELAKDVNQYIFMLNVFLVPISVLVSFTVKSNKKFINGVHQKN